MDLPRLQKIPIIKNQGFSVIQLGKNLRNSGQILDHSYKIQEDNIIESAILQQPPEGQSGFNKDISETGSESESEISPFAPPRQHYNGTKGIQQSSRSDDQSWRKNTLKRGRSTQTSSFNNFQKRRQKLCKVHFTIRANRSRSQLYPSSCC